MSTTQPRAYVRQQRPSIEPRFVILLARTGGRKTVKVRDADTPTPRVYGVYPFDLLDIAGKRLDQAVIDALPWHGAGDDPLDPEGKRAPITARMPAAVVEGIES